MSDNVKIFFTFNGEQKEVEGKKDEFMFSVYTRYVKMIGQEIEKVFFLNNGDLINPEKNLKDICAQAIRKAAELMSGRERQTLLGILAQFASPA